MDDSDQSGHQKMGHTHNCLVGLDFKKSVEKSKKFIYFNVDE